MSTLEAAMPTILKNEGRRVNHKNDPGGDTDFGISLRFLFKTGDHDNDGWQDGDINRDNAISIGDIDSLSEEEATRLYRMYFWEPNHYHLIEDQGIATKCLDLAVNLGQTLANKVAQRAIRSALGLTLTEDGIMGKKTITAINMCNPATLLAALKSEAAGQYRSLVYSKPSFKEFLRGWMNRAYSSPIDV